MWEKGIKKTIFTLAVDNWASEITKLTFPLMQRYADKINANFHIMTDRKYPDWPITYEKFQIYELAQKMENDWNIFFDCDALIHPETPDFTLYLNKDTVAHCGNDIGTIRWKYDRFFLRDGRHIGSCNWCTIGSDWCIDLWHPVDDLTPQECIDRCFPTVLEDLSGLITPYHLIDDFICSRNIAKFGLKFQRLDKIIEEKYPGSWFFWHQYTIPVEQKVIEMKKVLQKWKLV